MTMIAGTVSVSDSGIEIYTPSSDQNAAKILYLLLNANLTPSTMYQATPNPPSVGADPNTGLPFTIGTDGSFTSLVTPGSVTTNPTAPVPVSVKQANAKLANTLAQWMVAYLQANASVTQAFGEMYSATVGPGQTLTNANQYYKITQFDTAGNSNGGTTISITNQNITINTSGTYVVTVDLSITSNANNVFYTATVFKNGVQNSTVVSRAKIGSAGDLQFIGLTDVATYNVGDVIDIRIQCDTAGKVLTVDAGNFNVHSVGGNNAGPIAGGIL